MTTNRVETQPPPSPNGANGQPKSGIDGHAAPPAGGKPAATAPPQGERGAGGRFLPGNKGGPGNPFARRVAALRKAFFEAVDEGKIRRLAEALYEKAVGGDAAAAALLMKYLMGRPAEAVDPDRLDLEEFRLIEAMPTKHEVMRAMIDSVPPATATSLLCPILDDAAKDGMKRVCHKVGNEDAKGVFKERVHRHRNKPK
jgi:hypothetical protein